MRLNITGLRVLPRKLLAKLLWRRICWFHAQATDSEFNFLGNKGGGRPCPIMSNLYSNRSIRETSCQCSVKEGTLALLGPPHPVKQSKSDLHRARLCNGQRHSARRTNLTSSTHTILEYSSLIPTDKPDMIKFLGQK
jgi:hypothetical protein